ncbi:MAG: HAD family phosphatase [Candidatus Levybacteria bacterium]|nr:HAD family phosphatase [Candidatus Levybacteria bacterium]
MIKLIIFDLGGVVFTNGTKNFAKYLSEKYQKDFEETYNFLNYSDIGNGYREGKITRNGFWKKAKEELQLKEEVDELEKIWINCYDLITETKNIILQLKNKYKLFYLSDNVRERVDALDKKYYFLEWFDDGIFSHDIGVRKPNPRIYELTLKKAQVRPEEAIFIDDKESSLPPAQNLGIKTILFTSPEQLRKDLKNFGAL